MSGHGVKLALPLTKNQFTEVNNRWQHYKLDLDFQKNSDPEFFMQIF